jgi:CheY-like chemotaxis protein
MKNKILICDDDAELLLICTYILEKKGYQVITSSHCNNITKLVRETSPDVILMDNWIPDAGGIAASRELKSDNAVKHIPIVYFSASNDIQTLAKQAGAEAFLSKPFELAELEKVVAVVLEK